MNNSYVKRVTGMFAIVMRRTTERRSVDADTLGDHEY